MERPQAVARPSIARLRTTTEEEHANAHEERQRLHVPSRSLWEDPAKAARDETSYPDRGSKSRRAFGQDPVLREKHRHEADPHEKPGAMWCECQGEHAGAQGCKRTPESDAKHDSPLMHHHGPSVYFRPQTRRDWRAGPSSRPFWVNT